MDVPELFSVHTLYVPMFLFLLHYMFSEEETVACEFVFLIIIIKLQVFCE